MYIPTIDNKLEICLLINNNNDLLLLWLLIINNDDNNPERPVLPGVIIHCISRSMIQFFCLTKFLFNLSFLRPILYCTILVILMNITVPASIIFYLIEFSFLNA